MARRVDVVLQEIFDAIMLVESELSRHIEASFSRALFLQRATERSLEIISEATRHLPDALIATKPEIAWGEVRGIGNRLRHEYWRVDSGLIWSIVMDDLPALKTAIEDLLRGIEE
jgi:uncharacterized protein with HEPN domain